MTMNFWDQQYAADEFRYGQQPNAFLAEHEARLPRAARVLLPGDGEGRNSVWLASRGHQVLAMDGSAVGLAKAQAMARARGVAIGVEQGDLADWAPAPSTFDAVVLVFVHLPPAIRRDAHRRLAQGLKPGGLLLLEAFHPRQLGRSSGGPRQADMLYALGDLQVDFDGLLDEQLGQETETLLDEGPGHQGPGALTRDVGRRRRPIVAAAAPVTSAGTRWP